MSRRSGKDNVKRCEHGISVGKFNGYTPSKPIATHVKFLGQGKSFVCRHPSPYGVKNNAIHTRFTQSKFMSRVHRADTEQFDSLVAETDINCDSRIKYPKRQVVEFDIKKVSQAANEGEIDDAHEVDDLTAKYKRVFHRAYDETLDKYHFNMLGDHYDPTEQRRQEFGDTSQDEADGVNDGGLFIGSLKHLAARKYSLMLLNLVTNLLPCDTEDDVGQKINTLRKGVGCLTRRNIPHTDMERALAKGSEYLEKKTLFTKIASEITADVKWGVQLTVNLADIHLLCNRTSVFTYAFYTLDVTIGGETEHYEEYSCPQCTCKFVKKTNESMILCMADYLKSPLLLLVLQFSIFEEKVGYFPWRSLNRNIELPKQRVVLTPGFVGLLKYLHRLKKFHITKLRLDDTYCDETDLLEAILKCCVSSLNTLHCVVNCYQDLKIIGKYGLKLKSLTLDGRKQYRVGACCIWAYIFCVNIKIFRDTGRLQDQKKSKVPNLEEFSLINVFTKKFQSCFLLDVSYTYDQITKLRSNYEPVVFSRASECKKYQPESLLTEIRLNGLKGVRTLFRDEFYSNFKEINHYYFYSVATLICMNVILAFPLKVSSLTIHSNHKCFSKKFWAFKEHTDEMALSRPNKRNVENIETLTIIGEDELCGCNAFMHTNYFATTLSSLTIEVIGKATCCYPETNLFNVKLADLPALRSLCLKHSKPAIENHDSGNFVALFCVLLNRTKILETLELHLTALELCFIASAFQKKKFPSSILKELTTLKICVSTKQDWFSTWLNNCSPTLYLASKFPKLKSLVVVDSNKELVKELLAIAKDSSFLICAERYKL